jgi:hypothetical protein
MRSLTYLVVIIIFSSCNSRSSIKDEKEVTMERTYIFESLNIPDSFLQSNEFPLRISQTSVNNRIELNVFQKKKLFERNPELINESIFLLPIREVHDGIFLLFLLVESLSKETLYMMTVDNSAAKLDDFSYSDGDFFDVVYQSLESETGFFQRKYFQILNDSMVSFRTIMKEEEKAIGGSVILSSQIDSLTYDYLINIKGKFELIHTDSVRLYLKLSDW